MGYITKLWPKTYFVQLFYTKPAMLTDASIDFSLPPILHFSADGDENGIKIAHQHETMELLTPGIFLENMKG